MSDQRVRIGRHAEQLAALSLGQQLASRHVVFGAMAHFERRLIAERTKDGIAAPRARGKHPGRQPVDLEKVAAALKLVEAGLSPTAVARQLGLGRSTVYREVKLTGVRRSLL